MPEIQEPHRLLLIEDEDFDAEFVIRSLQNFKASRYEVTHVTTLRAGLEAIGEGSFHAVLLDLGLPDAVDLDGLQRLQRADADLPVIVCSGLDCHDTALRAVQQGAQEYMVKSDLDPLVLAQTIASAVERKRCQLMSRARP